MKKLIILISIIFLINCNLNCQTQFQKVLANSEIKYHTLVYVDEKNNYYQRSLLGGVSYDVIFTKVKLINNSNTFLVQGFTILDGANDTVGISDINLFLGKIKGDSIGHIRKLGKSKSMNLNSKYKDGFFSFKTKVGEDDKLFFCNYGGGELKEFYIGKLVDSIKEMSQLLPSR